MNRFATMIVIASALHSTLVLAQAASAPEVSLAVPADSIAAGLTVRLAERTEGDLLAAGSRVDLVAPVDGDTVVAGREVRVGAPLAGDVYVAGGRVQLDGELGRNLRAAGGQVELGSSARLAGNATIAAGDVSVRGPIKGTLRIFGGRTLIDASVDGDVTVTAQQIELGPQARIGGALRWRSQGDLQRHASAQVTGPMERLAADPEHDGSAGGPRGAGHGHWPREAGHFMGWLASIWWTAGMMVVAVVVLAAFPGLASEMALTWRGRTGTSLLAGFIALVCIPVAVVVLLLTVIGVPLALLALLLYFVLLPVGYVISAIGLGQWGLARWRPERAGHLGWRIGAALLALVLLALLGAVPWLGGLVALAALLIGLGAIVLQFWPRSTTAPALA